MLLSSNHFSSKLANGSMQLGPKTAPQPRLALRSLDMLTWNIRDCAHSLESLPGTIVNCQH